MDIVNLVAKNNHSLLETYLQDHKDDPLINQAFWSGCYLGKLECVSILLNYVVDINYIKDEFMVIFCYKIIINYFFI